MDLSKIKEIKSYEKVIHLHECKTEKERIDLYKSCNNQYLKITYPEHFITIYIYVKILFVNPTSISLEGPTVTFINICNQVKFTYYLHGLEIILFSENPIISILSKEDFINQVNQIKNSYINF